MQMTQEEINQASTDLFHLMEVERMKLSPRRLRNVDQIIKEDIQFLENVQMSVGIWMPHRVANVKKHYEDKQNELRSTNTGTSGESGS